jgi:enoyl-CoA hydratase
MSVRVEKQGPVTTVILGRPEARNAVDPETALARRDLGAAMQNELRQGNRVLETGAKEGAGRFAAGAGRGGKAQ